MGAGLGSTAPHAHRPHRTPPHRTMGDLEDALVKWAIAHGARIPGFKIGSGPSGERGVFARTALHAKAEILTVPRMLVTTDADARCRVPAVLAACRTASSLCVSQRPEIQLMIFLVADWARVDEEAEAGTTADRSGTSGEPDADADADALKLAPSLRPYYAALPHEFSLLPTNWPSDLLDVLLPPSRAATARAQAAEIAVLTNLLRTIAPAMLTHAEVRWGKSGRSGNPVSWAYTIVRSRAFKIEMGGKARAALCPLVDMLNHESSSAVNADWHFEGEPAGRGEERAQYLVAD